MNTHWHATTSGATEPRQGGVVIAATYKRMSVGGAITMLKHLRAYLAALPTISLARARASI
jgi:hypothetical protein